MSTDIHSFSDIFDIINMDQKSGQLIKKIVIPIVQRDYAQGRVDPNVKRVRERFVEALYDAITKNPITLDFVFGDIDDKGIMTPLDGQQRLTTLFLLHWYASRKVIFSKENNVDALEKFKEDCDFLKKFSYETRYSARDFCDELVNFVPQVLNPNLKDENSNLDDRLSKEIINQTWFPLEWKKDPTISSMLVMLDTIDNKFKNVDNLWHQLINERKITFYFLPIKDMGLTDELYIKMNSRGKPLTLFEHFKAELEHQIQVFDDEFNKNIAKRIIRKIDVDWTDMLWKYRNGGTGTSNDDVIDDEFLHYFKFICDIICYKKGESPRGKSTDEFDLLQMYFSSKNEDFEKNIEMLESFFDCWCGFIPKDFLESFMSQSHEPGKICINSIYDIDIFGDCLHTYSDTTGNRRKFPLNRMVLLYTIVFYLRNKDKITEKDFRRRVRIVNNLIQNSENEVSDRTDRNRIPAILEEIDIIMSTGMVDSTKENNFNKNQLEEEKDKINYLKNNPNFDEDILFKLEDNPKLYGQISIVGLDNLNYSERFNSLFSKCNLDKIDCALMSIGDYGQKEPGNTWRYQYASVQEYAWNNLFHKSGNKNFEETKTVLIKLLEKSEIFTDDILQGIIDSFVNECKKEEKYPWRYYYVNYKEYRHGTYGKLSNDNVEQEPYMFFVLHARSQISSNAYIPYLKVADVTGLHLSKEPFGNRLIYGEDYIVCENAKFIKKNSDGSEDIIEIEQDDKGIDQKDRIEILKKYIRDNHLDEYLKVDS